VKAYKLSGLTKIYSGNSLIANAKPIPSVPSNYKATRINSTSNKLTWNSVSGANRYELYRATSSNETYSLLKRTSSLYFTNSGLTTGKTYYYKLKSYRTVGTTNVYSNWTPVLSAKP